MEEILLRLGFDSSAVAKGMRSMHESVTHSLKEMRSGFNTVFEHVGAMFSAGALIAGLEKILSKVKEISNEAENLSVSTDFLQGIKEVGDKFSAGGSEGMSKGLGELSRKLGEAKSGSEDAIKTFEKWGFTIRDIGSLDTEGMFYKISDAVKNVQDPSVRAAMAFELLGKSGKQMASMLGMGSEELKRLVGEEDKWNQAQMKSIRDAKMALDDAEQFTTIALGKIISLYAEMWQSIGKMTLPKEVRMAAAREEERQWIDDIAKRAKAKIDAEEAAEKQADEMATKRDKDKADRGRASTQRLRELNAQLEARKSGWGTDEKPYMEKKIELDKQAIEDIQAAMKAAGQDENEQMRLTIELKEAELKLMQDQEALQKKMTTEEEKQAEAGKRHVKAREDAQRKLASIEKQIAKENLEPAKFGIDELAQYGHWDRRGRWVSTVGADMAQDVLDLRADAKDAAMNWDFGAAEDLSSRATSIEQELKRTNPFLKTPLDDILEQQTKAANALEAINQGKPVVVVGAEE